MTADANLVAAIRELAAAVTALAGTERTRAYAPIDADDAPPDDPFPPNDPWADANNPLAVADADTHVCRHGNRVYREGVSKAGRAYKVWSCTAPREDECEPQWVH